MADSKIVVTEQDVREPLLLLRLLRKVSDSVGETVSRLGKLERAPTPPTFREIKNALQANGSAPLNLTALQGVAGQPQLAMTPRSTAAPTGLVLQQYKDAQLLLVGTTSTGFALNTVVGGNPSVLFQLLGSLTTSSVGSTSTNLMTLNTTQIVTTAGIKTVQAGWTFTASQTITSTVDGNIVLTISTTSTTGTAARSQVLVANDIGNIAFISHTSPRVAARCGITLGGWGEMLANSVSGFLIDTQTTTAIVMGTNNLERFRIDGDGNLTLAKKVINYNSIATVNNGVPAEYASIQSTAQTADINFATAYTVPGTASFMYRVNGYIATHTITTSTAAFAVLRIRTNDGVASKTFTANTIALAADNYNSTLLSLVCAGGTAIEYSTSGGNYAGGAKYNLYLLVEAL